MKAYLEVYQIGFSMVYQLCVYGFQSNHSHCTDVQNRAGQCSEFDKKKVFQTAQECKYSIWLKNSSQDLDSLLTICQQYVLTTKPPSLGPTCY